MFRNVGGPMAVVALSVGFPAIVAHAWDAPETELERYSTLTLDYQTPHTAWARPYAQGPVRGYYFVYTWGEGMHTHAREAVELMQRLDLRLDVSYLYNYYREHWFGGDAGEGRIARLMASPHDVFIFQDLPPSKLPASPLQDGQTPFLEKVRAGAGVVLIGTAEGKLFNDAQAIADLPPFLARTGAVKVMTMGEGRIVQMPARPLIGYRVGWEVEYDYWQERLARAVLWAAKREPAVQLRIATEATMDRQKLPAEAVTVSWKGATAGETAISVRLRRWDGRQAEIGAIKCDRAEGQAAVSVPLSRAGAYHVDAFARSPKGAEGWATAATEVTSLVQVGALELVSRQEMPRPVPPAPAAPGAKTAKAAAVAAAKAAAAMAELERRGVFTPFVEIGEAIQGKVGLTGDTAGHALRISLVDRQGRELVRKDLPARGEQAFAFKAEAWMPALLRVEARLLKDDQEVAFSYGYQRLTNRRQGQFNFVLWGAPGDETLGPYAMDKLAELGVTTILHSTPAPLSVSAFHMGYVPWTGGPMGNPEGWPDPEYGRRHAEVMLRSRGSGVLAYSLGDEGAVAGAGDGPNSDAAFAGYLKGVYGDIAALNRSWKGHYASFVPAQFVDWLLPRRHEPHRLVLAADHKRLRQRVVLDVVGHWRLAGPPGPRS